MTVYLKALRTGRVATHVDGFVWPEPGEWLEVEGPLVPCENGLHVATPAQVLDWLSDELWLVEVDGETLDGGDKTVARRARLVRQLPWDERVAREFAADCAERVLHLFEREHPGDDRPRKAIVAARAFARGDSTRTELAAAGDAAWDAARAAARAAAGAAGNAASSAARAAARDAARAAARAAAWDAARAAARAAAWDAARDAARDAAWDAERAWQTAHLCALLGIEGES